MSNIKIKICGIKTTPVLDCCKDLGVNYFGLIFYKKSPRNINTKKATNLINIQKKNNIIPVGIFVNHNFTDLIELIKITNLKYVQLHGSESNNYISKLKDKKKLTVIKAINIQKL